MIGLALRHGMIDEGACRGGSVQVRMGRSRISLDERRERLFVLGVVRAYQRLLRDAWRLYMRQHEERRSEGHRPSVVG